MLQLHKSSSHLVLDLVCYWRWRVIINSEIIAISTFNLHFFVFFYFKILKHLYFCSDAMLTSAINCATSFLSGFVVFSVLGHMCYRMNRTMDTVANEGRFKISTTSYLFLRSKFSIYRLPRGDCNSSWFNILGDYFHAYVNYSWT